MSARAPLSEVFVSFQGEGPLVGVRQAFARVRGCDIHCTYCDTADSRQIDGECVVENAASGERLHLPNPFTPADALDLVRRALGQFPAHSLAVTGGEPLLYPEFVSELAVLAQGEGLPVYLETGGHRPDDLALVIEAIAYASIDYKLPGLLREPVPGQRFVESYRIAGARCVGVKMVVSRGTPAAEVADACRALAQVSDAGPVILQPVTALGAGLEPPGPEQLHRMFAAASEHIRDVRVIPQCHRMMGVA